MLDTLLAHLVLFFLKELASEKCSQKKYDFRSRLREMRSLELEWSLRSTDLSDFKESVL